MFKSFQLYQLKFGYYVTAVINNILYSKFWITCTCIWRKKTYRFKYIDTKLYLGQSYKNIWTGNCSSSFFCYIMYQLWVFCLVWARVLSSNFVKPGSSRQVDEQIKNQVILRLMHVYKFIQLIWLFLR